MVTKPGPWDDEPDKAQWIDEKTGLDCLIVRAKMGNLCGYVGVPDTHPLHGQPVGSQALGGLVSHGEITFAAPCMEMDDPASAPAVCHVPEPGRPDNVWWLGFDCMHADDLVPAVWCLLDDSLYLAERSSVEYRNFAYVRVVVGLLALQLADAGRERR